MAMQAHLVELERKHKILENELHEALVHLSTDDLQIVELKRRKLMVKDEIERLETYGERNAALGPGQAPRSTDVIVPSPLNSGPSCAVCVVPVISGQVVALPLQGTQVQPIRPASSPT